MPFELNVEVQYEDISSSSTYAKGAVPDVLRQEVRDLLSAIENEPPKWNAVTLTLTWKELGSDWAGQS